MRKSFLFKYLILVLLVLVGVLNKNSKKSLDEKMVMELKAKESNNALVLLSGSFSKK